MGSVSSNSLGSSLTLVRVSGRPALIHVYTYHKTTIVNEEPNEFETDPNANGLVKAKPSRI